LPEEGFWDREFNNTARLAGGEILKTPSEGGFCPSDSVNQSVSVEGGSTTVMIKLRILSTGK
jgi:hypothetical protein